MINKDKLFETLTHKKQYMKKIEKQYNIIENEIKCDKKFEDIKDFQKYNEPVIICGLCYNLKSVSCFTKDKKGSYNKNCDMCYNIGISKNLKKLSNELNFYDTYLYCEVCDVNLKIRKTDKSGQTLKRHHKSRTHIKNVKKIEFREKHYNGTVFNICN